ncbi:ABC transporter substrate-binding protein [Desertimonas flava]|uniref:ABC transporter substrate-binding protein n=1 Tax=Desertimonas flava TaxID=2064846 RepID=UPI0013C4A3CF|nr:ABC transporter substrate-binding protein [Desertimonas flava]
MTDHDHDLDRSNEGAPAGLIGRRALLGAAGAIGAAVGLGALAPSAASAAARSRLAAAAGRAASAPPAGAMKLGWVLPTTGALASSFKPIYASAQVAVDDLNAAGGVLGAPIEVIEYDDEANPARQPAVFRKVSEDGVSFVCGPTGSSAALAGVPVATELKVITFANANATALTDAATYPYNFTFNYTAVTLAEVLLAGAQSLGLTKVAILAEDSALGQEVTEIAPEIAETLGVELVASEKHPLDASDFRPYLRTLQDSGAEGIVSIQSSGPNIAATLQGLDNLGWAPPIVGSALHIALDTVLKTASDELLPQLYTIQFKNWTRQGDEPVGEAQRDFIAKLSAIEGTAGRELAVAGNGNYDYLTLLAKVIEEIGAYDVDAIRDALEATTAYEGLSATFSFSAESHAGVDADALTIASIASINDAESEGIYLQAIEA